METIKNYYFMDMGVMFGRSMRHIFRSVDTIMTVTISPVAIMLLFVFVLGGAIQIATDNYVNYLLPGIMLMTIANGIGYVSYRLLLDKQRGIFERFHSMPIARSAALWGHVLVSLVSNAISVTVIILIAFLMGFRSPAGVLPWLAVVGILGLFTLALTWIAVIAGLSAKSADSAGAFAFVIHLLPFISSAFVPTNTMPKAVRVFAENQPVTSIVNAIRALLNDQPVGSDIWVALAWCVGIMLVAYVFAMRVYKKRV
ncbi:MAG: ABC transporter permease [Bacteroidetes bacterium GWF2_42_66]|nr:MAG: ABC transporter permease [Bacteroidetes bacterium GWE2_42_39]OFY42017.1 MAG: ABC transporter permease [Bacteroidetes bacterium GWF2_42_66]HBL77784.1 ABC transporter permease [Prolixibacteraceae bacterium]HCU63265.1 ABC transporter permease [Prolixibacteraceae bacterium]